MRLQKNINEMMTNEYRIKEVDSFYSSGIESKFDADEQASQFRFYNRKNTFVKRYSDNG